jgi:GntR family transcriptional regulator, histidine utilization repressor
MTETKSSLHQRIRQEIETGILSGALKPGDRIPSEMELMAHYGCARMTVNKALSALASAGLIERRKRAGSFVSQPRLHSMVLDIPDLVQQVASRGEAYRFTMISRRIRADRTRAAGGFGVAGGKVLALDLLHFAQDRELAVEQRQVNLTAVPAMAQEDFASDPPGTWLLQHVPWTEAETRISALAADEQSAGLLLIPVGAPLLCIERRTWRGEDPITIVRQTFRAEAYDLYARFKSEQAGDRAYR